MVKKVIALAGSPRRRGNTGLLLEAAVKGVQATGVEVALIVTNSLKVKPCQGCNTCYKVGGCIYQDDMMQIYDAFNKADAFIISSPVYFGSVTAQLKTVIDRFQSFWAIKDTEKFRSGKDELRPGIFLGTAGHPNPKGTRFDSSLEVVKTLGFAIDMKLVETVLAADTDRIPVTEEADVVDEAYKAGKLLGEMVNKANNS